MKKFLFFFALEFSFIFVVAAAAYALLHVPYNWWQILISSSVSAVVIALVLQKNWKKDGCGK
jgi:hypothetical protein